jgi:4-aminobutyrate aminotransferase/(S)-3-amino-2-methylpropionate transaminase
VIEMMEEEKLPERAQIIGEKVLARFRRLQERYPRIGDVRGLGAMCAMELVKGPDKTPDKEMAGKILAQCNRRGVILMGAGLYSNVIRVLTPLVITDEQLEEGLDVIEEVVDEVLGK